MENKVFKNHTVSATGILNIDDFTIEVEDDGVFFLKDVLEDFDGCKITLSVTYAEEIKPSA